MTVTVVDIAKAAGVSQPTVSQVLNGKGRISSETRDRVLSTAQSLGYRPNSYARAMLSRRTGNLGLLLSDSNTRSKLLPGLMQGLQDGVIAHHQHLVVGRVPDELLTDPEHVPRLLKEFAADGLLINYFQGIPVGLRQLVRACKIPVVWINSRIIQPCVYPDDHSGGAVATRRLIEKGHTRIAFLVVERDRGIDTDQHYSISDRRQGYLDAMKDAGLTPQVVEVPDDHALHMTAQDVRVRMTRERVFEKDAPSAVITYSGADAVVAAMAANQAGLTIGTDLALVTFHPEPPAMLPFPVTVWIVPLQAVGSTAVNTLMRRIDGRTIKQDQPMPYQEWIGQD